MNDDTKDPLIDNDNSLIGSTNVRANETGSHYQPDQKARTEPMGGGNNTSDGLGWRERVLQEAVAATAEREAHARERVHGRTDRQTSKPDVHSPGYKAAMQRGDVQIVSSRLPEVRELLAEARRRYDSSGNMRPEARHNVPPTHNPEARNQTAPNGASEDTAAQKKGVSKFRLRMREWGKAVGQFVLGRDPNMVKTGPGEWTPKSDFASSERDKPWTYTPTRSAAEKGTQPHPKPHPRNRHS